MTGTTDEAEVGLRALIEAVKNLQLEIAGLREDLDKRSMGYIPYIPYIPTQPWTPTYPYYITSTSGASL